MNKPVWRKFWMFLASFFLWCVMVLFWSFVWYHYFAEIIDLPFYRRGNWVVIGIYAVILGMITHFYGGYKIGYYKRGDVLFSCELSMLMTNIITYLQSGLIARRLLDPHPFLLLCIADGILIWVWSNAANRLYIFLNPPRRLLLVYGGSEQANSLIQKMLGRDDKYIIQEAVCVDEGTSEVLDCLQRFEAVVICDVPSQPRNRILKYCYKHHKRVYMTPKISDVLIRGADSIHLFDTPLLLTRGGGLAFEQRFLKRALDLLLVCPALLVLSPVFLLVAIAVKLGDNGPVLYRQTRLTIDGKPFSLYKFRSMIIDAEKGTGAVLAREDDDRITSVGKTLRKYRLDELPQLFNIFKGDMSIVGPRPERPELTEQYCMEMEEFSFRLRVKAGLTGYAQVLGKYNTTPYDKLKLDLMYISTYSILLDVKLILMTIKILFRKESTEGV